MWKLCYFVYQPTNTTYLNKKALRNISFCNFLSSRNLQMMEGEMELYELNEYEFLIFQHKIKQFLEFKVNYL